MYVQKNEPKEGKNDATALYAITQIAECCHMLLGSSRPEEILRQNETARKSKSLKSTFKLHKV